MSEYEVLFYDCESETLFDFFFEYTMFSTKKNSSTKLNFGYRDLDFACCELKTLQLYNFIDDTATITLIPFIYTISN